jgi:hypothetical protein
MVYLHDACDQISDFCHQQLLRKISFIFLVLETYCCFFGNFSILLCFSDLANCHIIQFFWEIFYFTFLYPRFPKGEGGILFYLCPSVRPSIQDIFLSNCWWQKSDIVKSKKTKKNKVKVVNFQKLMGYWKTKEYMVPFQSTVKSLLRTFKLGLFFHCSHLLYMLFCPFVWWFGLVYGDKPLSTIFQLYRQFYWWSTRRKSQTSRNWLTNFIT